MKFELNLTFLLSISFQDKQGLRRTRVRQRARSKWLSEIQSKRQVYDFSTSQLDFDDDQTKVNYHQLAKIKKEID